MSFVRLLASCSVVALIAPSGANAQVAPSQSGSATPADPVANEIIVTATRKDERLQKVPMTINVVRGADLQKLDLFDAKDIQTLAPGLELTNTTGRSNTATLRGIPYDPDSGASPAVDLYYNEIPVSAQTAFTALYDIDQIEVLHGPQGSLRGRTSPAGSITIASRKPDLDKIDGYAEATASDLNAQNFQGGVSLPLIEDKLAIRAAALVDHSLANDVYNITRNQRSHSSTESARFSIAWKPVESVRVDLSYQYLNADNYQFSQVFGPGNQPSLFSPQRSGPAATIKDRIAVTDGLQRFQNNSNLLTGSIDWDLGSNSLTLIGGYQNTTLTQQNDLDNSNAIPGYAQEQQTTSPYVVGTAELRFASQNHSFWNYSLDAFFTKQTGTTVVHQPNNLFFGSTAYNTPYPYSFGAYLPLDVTVIAPANGQTFSLAGSSSFQFTPKLKLEAAARYSWYKSTASLLIGETSTGYPAAFIPGFSIPPAETIPAADRKLDPKALTGSATLSYQISPSVNAYVNYGRSFRPGVVASGISVPVSNNLLVTKNETSDAVEAGLKTSIFDHRLSLSADGFYQYFKNYIGRVPTGIYIVGNDGTTAFTQLNFNGNAVIKGAEATLSGKVTRDFDVSLSVSYVDAHYKNALAPCNDYAGTGTPNTTGAPAVTGGGNVSFCTLNSRLADVPDFNLSTNGEYRFHTGDYQPFVRYLFTYTPKVYSVQSAFLLPDRENLNLYVGLRAPHDRFEITAFMKNVFNQQRITSYGQSEIGTENGPAFNSGYAAITSTLPREFGGSVLFHF